MHGLSTGIKECIIESYNLGAQDVLVEMIEHTDRTIIKKGAEATMTLEEYREWLVKVLKSVGTRRN